MAQFTTAISDRLYARRCLRCGHEGEELQRDGAMRVFDCPACGEDLYARPPRSYAEMEGLVTGASDGCADVAPARSTAAPAAMGLLGRLLTCVRRVLRVG